MYPPKNSPSMKCFLVIVLIACIGFPNSGMIVLKIDTAQPIENIWIVPYMFSIKKLFFRALYSKNSILYAYITLKIYFLQTSLCGQYEGYIESLPVIDSLLTFGGMKNLQC